MSVGGALLDRGEHGSDLPVGLSDCVLTSFAACSNKLSGTESVIFGVLAHLLSTLSGILLPLYCSLTVVRSFTVSSNPLGHLRFQVFGKFYVAKRSCNK